MQEWEGQHTIWLRISGTPAPLYMDKIPSSHADQVQPPPSAAAAFDEPMLAQCREHGLPCVSVEMGTQAADFRGDFAAFRLMGAVKVRCCVDVHLWAGVCA